MKDVKDSYPNNYIGLITTKIYETFFSNSNLFNEIIIDERENLIKTFYFLLKVVKFKPNLIIDLQNSRRTNFYEFFFRLFTFAKINGTGLFCNIRFKNDYSNLSSVIVGLSNQVEKLNIKTRRKPYLDWLLKDNFDWNKIKNKNFFIINPGCSKNNLQKRWKHHNFVKICNFLASKNILPILIGASDDRSIIKKIENESINILNLCDKSPLDLVYKISTRAIGALSNDTGPAHLIASSGCKIHLVLSSFSNVNTVIPKGGNVSYTQKVDINDISYLEVIKEIKKNYGL